MKKLETTHPEILLAGNVCVQLSDVNSFGKIPDDQAIEETINKHSKIPGGIIGKSRNVKAVSQWVDTTADQSQVTENMRLLTEI